MIYYRISPQCTDSKSQQLYLTAQRTTNTVVVATSLSGDDRAQLWTPVVYISGSNHGFVLLNAETNQVISAPGDNEPVILTTLDDMKRGTWAFNGQGHGALQLQANTDMNLNVSGNGPYESNTKVSAWSWSRGQTNELWTFQRVPT